MSALKELVVNEADIAEEDLADALRPYLRFTSTGGLLPEAAFFELTTEQRVLCVLLAVQALRMLGMRDDDEVGPTDIVELSGMAAGSVRPKLSALRKARLATAKAGKYRIPVPAIRLAMARLGAPRRG